MEKVWIVMGSTGEYSDRREWPVVAFMSEAAAKDRIAALDVRMQEMPQQWREVRWDHEGDMKAHMAALDPDFVMDYTGTSYFFYEVEVVHAAMSANQ